MHRSAALLPLLLLLQANAYAQVVDTLTPGAVTRGTTATLRLDGADLSTVTRVTVEGDGVALTDHTIESDARLRVTLQVSDRAAEGPRTLVLTGSDELTLTDAFEVRAGAPDVIFVTPSTGARGEAVSINVGGRNLDVVTAPSFGAGVSVNGWTVTDPTRATATLDIGPAATTGPHQITLAVDDMAYLAAATFDVTGGTPAITTATPAAAIRGETVEVVLEGRNLDTLIDANFGSRVDVSPLRVTNPTRALVTVSPGDDATRGPREITVRDTEGVSYALSDGFTVLPGELIVTRLRPDRVGQGEGAALTFEGENLDGVTTVACGEGITTTHVDASQPLELLIEVEVDAAAPLGFRDCVLEGVDGTYVAQDLLIVEEPTLPPVRLRFEEEIQLGDVEVGAWVRRNIIIENTGERDETVTIGDAAGDIDLFALLGDDGRRVTEVTLELPAHDAATFRIEYHPEGQNQSSAAFAVSARDEVVGQILMRAFAIAQTLTFDPPSPADLGVVPPDTPTPLPRVDLDLTGAGLPETVAVEAVEVELFYNNAPVEADTYLTLALESSRSGDTYFWGNTELQWEFEGPIGSYRGTLLVYTDSDTAGLVPLSFSLIARDEAGEDTGDVDTDTGVTDTGIADTSVVDTGSTDTGTAVDTGTDDVGVDAGDDTSLTDAGTPDTGEAPPSDDTGCCATTGGSRPPWSTLGLVGLVLGWRRRRRG